MSENTIALLIFILFIVCLLWLASDLFEYFADKVEKESKSRNKHCLNEQGLPGKCTTCGMVSENESPDECSLEVYEERTNGKYLVCLSLILTILGLLLIWFK
jgi:hypothetical protein